MAAKKKKKAQKAQQRAAKVPKFTVAEGRKAGFRRKAGRWVGAGGKFASVASVASSVRSQRAAETRRARKIERERERVRVEAQERARARREAKARAVAGPPLRGGPVIRPVRVRGGRSDFARAMLAESKRLERVERAKEREAAKAAKAAKAEARLAEKIKARERKAVYEPPRPAPAWTWGREREPKTVQEIDETVLRGPRGQFLSKTEMEKLKKIRAIEREFAEKLQVEKEFKARMHPITDDRRQELVNMLKRVAKRMKDVSLDFGASIATEFDGHAMHGKVELTGLTPAKVDEQAAMDQISQLVLDLVTQLKRQKIKKGLMIQLSFIPEESVYLQYGREGDLMTTAWAMVGKSSEVENLAPAVQRMVQAMIRNQWDLTTVRAMFFYDQTVAEGAPVKSTRTRGGGKRRKKKR